MHNEVSGMIELPEGISLSDTQPVEYSEDGEWIGSWFAPILHHRYTVPINTLNHKSEAGRTGVCIARRFNASGMSWALLEFEDEPHPDREKMKWIRTPFIIEAE